MCTCINYKYWCCNFFLSSNSLFLVCTDSRILKSANFLNSFSRLGFSLDEINFAKKYKKYSLLVGEILVCYLNFLISTCFASCR